MTSTTYNGRALRRFSAIAAVTAALALAGGAMAQTVKYSKASTSDATLIKSLPGFSNATARVNGTTIHYVVGGKGAPLVLLPGWPQTWWTFHKIMPELAKHYQVIAVDLRGMGSSHRLPVLIHLRNHGGLYAQLAALQLDL